MTNINDVIYFIELEKYSTQKLEDELKEEYLNFTTRYLKEQTLTLNANGDYQFNFVGLLIFKSFTIFILPKFSHSVILDDNRSSYLLANLTLKAIKKYNKVNYKHYTDNLFFTKELEDSSSLLDSAQFIINNYLDTGLIKVTHTELNVNGFGNINWEHTINNELPFINRQGAPVFTKLYTDDDFDYEHAYLKTIHKYVINYCSNLLTSPLINAIYNSPKIKLDVKRIDIKMASSYIKTIINSTFNDCELEILNSIYIVLNSIPQNYKKGHRNILIGVNKFESVWEKMLQELFSHETSLKEHMASPKFMSHTNNFYESKEIFLDPDILSVENNIFFILDAKYYDFYFYEKKAINNPGISDISKQFVYNLYFSHYINSNNLNTYNAFLFPKKISKFNLNTLNNSIKSVGSITLNELFPNCSIKLIKLDPIFIMQTYSENNLIPCDSLNSLQEIT